MDYEYKAPPETYKYAPQLNITWFDGEDIPDVPHHRSSYLHALNVTLENTCVDADADDDDAPEITRGTATWRVWNRVQDKVFMYWIRKRGDPDANVERDHRYMLWHVWGRIQFVLHRHSRRLKQVHESDFVKKRHLCVSASAVNQYSVADLWRAIHVLITAWNTLRFSDTVRDYVNALATQCGRYFWVALPTRRTFDHPSFVTRVTDAADMGATGGRDAVATCYCVNENFIVETERLFFELLRTLNEHNSLVEAADVVEVSPRATSYTALNKWIRKASDIGAVREFVAADFSSLVYERRAHPGEVERFAEKDPHADATPYNAIAKMRPEVIDQMSEMIEDENLIESLMDRMKIWDDDSYRNRFKDAVSAASIADDEEDEGVSIEEIHRETETDVDSCDVLITSAGYLLDDAFLTDHIRFSSWFVCNSPPVTGAQKLYPVLVRAFNAWHVVYDKKLWLCENAADAIECWVRALCTSASAFEAISHVAPRREPFYTAHRDITGGIAAEAELEEARVEAESRAGDAIMIPLDYEDEEE